jgi:NADH:ubiquinone oxidoreductase subunit E
VVELERVDQIIDAVGSKRSSLIPILQDIQSEYRYLPQDALKRVAERLDIPEVDVFGVATFYRSFSLTPRGKHTLTVCVGTACHVRGAPRLVDELCRRLEVKPGQTTSDGEFTLETVNCLGACALGPIVVVDDEYRGQVAVRDLDGILKECTEGRAEE